MSAQRIWRIVLAGVGLCLVLYLTRTGGRRGHVPARTPAPPVLKPELVTQPRPTLEGDLGTEFEKFCAETDEQKRAEWLGQLKAADFFKILEFLNHPEAKAADRALMLRVFHRTAELNPEAAAKWAMEHLKGRDRADFLANVATTWANQNLEASIAWAKQLPEEDRTGAISKIAYEATASDPRKALELARELPGGDLRNELITHIAGEWSAKSPEKIVEWASQIRDEGLRQQVVSRVAANWAETNPAAAAGLALNSLPAGKFQDDAVMGIVQRWVQSQPADAAAWVGQFPEGRLRDTAAEEVMKLWSDKNPADAGKWLDTLPAGSSRDAAASAYIGKVLETSPEAAGQWALQIQDEAARTSALERVANSWLASAPDKATDWINRATISEELKKRLLARKAP